MPIRGGNVIAIPESGSVAHVKKNAAAVSLTLQTPDAGHPPPGKLHVDEHRLRVSQFALLPGVVEQPPIRASRSYSAEQAERVSHALLNRQSLMRRRELALNATCPLTSEWRQTLISTPRSRPGACRLHVLGVTDMAMADFRVLPRRAWNIRPSRSLIVTVRPSASVSCPSAICGRAFPPILPY